MICIIESLLRFTCICAEFVVCSCCFAATCIFYFICLRGDLGCLERRHK